MTEKLGRSLGTRLPSHHLQLELVYRELVAVELLDEPVSVPLECVRGALALVRDALESDSPYPGLSGYRAPTLHEGTSGRPRLTFPGTCWHAYLEIRFTVPQIANILCVSVHTLRRRMSKYVLSVRALYLALTDDQLDNILGEIQAQFPTCGNRHLCKAICLHEEYEFSRGELESLKGVLIPRVQC